MRRSLLVLPFLCSFCSWADSIEVNGKLFEDVYISESSTMYIVCFPLDGSTKSFAKSSVDSNQVRITEDAYERGRLKTDWLIARERIVTQKALKEQQERERQEMLEKQAAEREAAARRQVEMEKLREREKTEAENAAKRIAEEQAILAAQAEQRERNKQLSRLAMFLNKLPIQEVETDQRAYVGKTFAFLAIVEVSSYYNYGWSDAQKTHHAFQLTCIGKDPQEIGTAHVYMKRSEKSEALRRIVLNSMDPSDAVLICGLYIPAQRFEDSMDLHAELLDYITVDDFKRLIDQAG